MTLRVNEVNVKIIEHSTVSRFAKKKTHEKEKEYHFKPPYICNKMK